MFVDSCPLTVILTSELRVMTNEKAMAPLRPPYAMMNWSTRDIGFRR